MKDNEGNSPLDVAVRKNKVNVALYLINCGCGSEKDKDKVLSQACQSGKLKGVKELVEQYNVNPKGKISLQIFQRIHVCYS